MLVIDDCSSDSVLSLKELETCYPNVRTFSTGINGGGGKARNIGLDNVRGKYVIFADADDFFLPSFDNILDKYSGIEFDLLFFNAISLFEDNFNLSSRTTHLTSHINKAINGDLKGLQFLKFLFGEPWCRIISHRMLVQNNVRFDEVRIHNDTKFAYLVGYYAEKIILDPTVAYCVIDRRESVSKQLGEDKNITRLEVFSKKNSFLLQHNISVFDFMMLNPLVSALKNHDLKKLNKYIKIITQNGVTKRRLIWESIKHKFFD